MLNACVPSAGTNSLRTSTSTENAETNGDDSSNNNNTGGINLPTPTNVPAFTQFEVANSLSSLASFNSDMQEAIYLRGTTVDNFIKTVSLDVQCIVSRFPNTVSNEFLVLAAIPRNRFSANDFNSVEKNYILFPNGDQNQIFCQKSSLINSLLNLSSGANIAYKVSNICPTCVASSFQSLSTELRSVSGAVIGQVATANINIRVQNNIFGNPSQTQCSQASECTNLGFDCCTVDGVCANDLTVKNGIDQSTDEFKDILAIVNPSPSKRRDYPQFFNVCPLDVPIDTGQPSGETASDNLESDARRLQHLRDIHECTTLQEGEMAFCTIEYDNVSTLNVQSFETGDDDRNFSTVYSGTKTIPLHSIVEVNYSGEILFRDGVFSSSEVKIGANNNLLGNDNLSDPGIIEMTKEKNANDTNDLLRIKYKIDGSCEEIGPTLAQCTKFYIQGENEGKVTDHFPASNKFTLPRYADINKTIQVFVDDVPRFNGTHWNITGSNPTIIEFVGDNLQVFEGQKLQIKFFVDSTSNRVLQAKKTALEEIKTMCRCPDLRCRLDPILTEKNGTNVVTDFGCKYPPADLAPAPLQQTVLMSSKTVPVRFFDENGEAQTEVLFGELPQEGIAFKYNDRDVLKPNNVDEYVGFNEIYGSLTPDATGAKPAEEIRVDKGKVYDIFVESGTFSSCFNCGTDYFANVARLFPQNFLTVGGGLFPQKFITDRKNSTGYRADDLIFGRACWLPVTMIPWSHRDDSDRQNQRLDRLQAQHFQFANGYQRDWYGFDYGSVIASFDGTTWFSVGNQRRIQAKTNKLFLALNQYFGDQTTESTYKIVVSESTTTAFSGAQVTNDFESDGAECQQEHICETDTDCVTKLGWDYSCQDISLLKSTWPEYDSLANEIPNHSIELSLRALFNQSQGGNRRCVYRGRGALCNTLLRDLDKEELFNQDDRPGNLACSENNYCQEFTLGSAAQLFNNKIARFAASANVQNNSSKVTESELDTFGLGTRSIGRPFAFNGGDSIPPEVVNNLQDNKALSMCIPGRSTESSTPETSNFQLPQATENGDKILNLGMTRTSLSIVDTQYFSSCPIIDPDSENKIMNDINRLTQSLDSEEIRDMAATQSYSTNHLRIFENILDEDITTLMSNRQLTQQTLGRNRCIRAPNSACFSNFECAPSNYISNFVKRIAKGQNSINDFELQFWSEELICGNEKPTTDPEYDHSENRCCRETNKTVQLPTFRPDMLGSERFNNQDMPGIDIALDDPERYSRNAITYKEVKSGSIPALTGPILNVCEEDDPDNCDANGGGDVGARNNQWKTFHLQASRMCCSKNWVRNFDTTNGGGHNWGPTKKQRVNKTNFSCYNWSEEVADTAVGSFYNCAGSDDPEDPDCPVRSLFPSDYEPILEVFERLELTGIPQISIDLVEDPTSPTACTAFPEGWSNPFGNDPPLLPYIMPGVLNDNVSSNDFERALPEFTDNNGGILTHKFAANDMDNFDPIYKKVFSEDTVSCCLPIGSELEDGEDRNLCCSGFLDETGEKPTCALPDYTNLSVYFNRYVSSEAAGLDETLFEPETGYFKSVDSVVELACQVNACASNTVAFGVAVTPLALENHVDTNKLFPRFIDSNKLATETEDEFAKIFEEGIRWNTQVYCYPNADDGTGDQDARIVIKSCLQ